MSSRRETRTYWGVLWRAKNALDGEVRVLVYESERQLGPALFASRAAARRYRDKVYGYIRDRADLKAPPHGWKLPSVVRVRATYELV
jgi:hypothetical protein